MARMFWKGTEYFANAGCTPEISWELGSDRETKECVGYVKMRTAKMLF